MDHRIALAPELEAAPAARHAAEAALREWGLAEHPRAPDVLVVVSELATNAVRHARSRLLVELGHADGCVRITVTDESAALPVLAESDPERTSGRGLLIVDALADHWGHVRTPTGKVVWAEISL